MSHDDLLSEVRAFLVKSGMGPVYFGQAAVKNPRLVERLANNKTVTLRTAERVRAFIAEREERLQ